MRRISMGGVFSIACASLLLVTATASASVYKWKDAQGRVHYSAAPPAEHNAERLRVKASDPGETEATADEAAPSPASNTSTPEGQPLGRKERAARDERREALKRNCENSRKNLSTLQDPTIRRVTTGGDTSVLLTDEERARRVKEAEMHVKEFCIE